MPGVAYVGKPAVTKSNRPLADAMRPENMEDFAGQQEALGKLGNFASHPRSMLFFGPPGCGKSTLALLLAKASGKKYVRISAPEAGITQLRRLLAGAEILILDELHRFSKAQQDFFLPLLENGELILLATTTENPSFSVTRQLLSRLHVVRLRPLSMETLILLGERATKQIGTELEKGTLELLARTARGDARTMLNLVEFTSTLDEEARKPEELPKALPEGLARHDKNGDNHYELASALIKSIRGSDADAALYYLACLLEGGEDPKFVCRRLILSAAEDVGLADPQALSLAVACQQAVEFTGMPEGFIPLAETVVYLALAPKSNSTYAAYLNASREVKRNGQLPVPIHLRNASTPMQKAWGYGLDYKYPHNYPDSWIEQTYLPEDLANKSFYMPRLNGKEAALVNSWRRLRGGKKR